MESITLSTEELTLTRGEKETLTATVTPNNADNKTVIWSSSKKTVAMVENGTVFAISEGTTIITAQAGGKTANCLVTVKPAVESVTLSETRLTLAPGKTEKLTATVTPNDADNMAITWSSDRTDIATVDDYGTVTAQAKGIAIITAQAGNKKATCTVYVTSQAAEEVSISLDKTMLALTPGMTEKLTARVTPNDADNKTVTWSSSNETVATVDNDGTVTAWYNEGTAIITARVGNKEAKCIVYVTSQAIEDVSITLDKTTLALTPGMTWKLTATVTPNDADNTTVTWSSTKTDIATVDDDGTVTAWYNEGTAIITAQVTDDIFATCEIIVKSALIAVDNITLDREMLTLAPGETGNLTATVTPNDADNKTVTWRSSNETVATVDNDGTVTAITIGTATITAKASDKTAKCEVTVCDHSYRNGKCTVCGAVPYLAGGEIDENGILTKYWYDEATVVIPNGVTSIGEYAFLYCSSLTNVTIPSSVTSIGANAFWICDNLKEITFKGTKEQWNAIEGSNNLNIEIIRCNNGNIGVLGVPSYLTVSGTAVTGYKGEVPANVVIPDGITSIGERAFYDCTSLESVTIPDGVTGIGHNAFFGCTSLESVTIGNGVESIGDFAFFGCTSLASVTIPNSVTSIGEYAFYICTSLSEITFEGTIEQWTAIEGSDYINVLGIRCSNGNIGILGVPSYLTVSGTVVTGYTGTVPANVVIPDGITSIGERAFYDCTSLENVTIPDSVTSIENGNYYNGAFRNCKNLKSVTIGNGVTSIGDYAFYGCTSLTRVEIPNSVESIGSDAFRSCTSLTSVTIGNGVTSIGGSAFYGCTSLESVTIPGSVTSIENSAFYGCTSLSTVKIGDGVKSIVDEAFRGCTSLTRVEIPNSVESIGSDAFRSCTILKDVTIGNGVTSIGNSAFYGCTNLERMTIPGSVTSIGGEAFYGCTSLSTVKIGDGVKSIGDEAFKGCTSLESVTIGNGVESIGDFAFYGCTSLKGVTIGDSVTSIGRNTFGDCTSLTSVTIPSSVTSISITAFRGCTSLTSVTIPNSVTSIESHAFYGCTSLTSVTIPGSVTSIGKYAFYGCTSLTSVTIGNGVTSIEFYAFKGCKKLETINYNDTKDNWKKITKANEWNGDTFDYTINCTDGKLDKSDNSIQ